MFPLQAGYFCLNMKILQLTSQVHLESSNANTVFPLQTWVLLSKYENFATNLSSSPDNTATLLGYLLPCHWLLIQVENHLPAATALNTLPRNWCVHSMMTITVQSNFAPWNINTSHTPDKFSECFHFLLIDSVFSSMIQC